MDTHFTLNRFLIATVLAIQVSSAIIVPARAADTVDHEIYLRMGAEIESEFRGGELTHWFPACVDRQHGGFISRYDQQWRLSPEQTKGLVFQSRMLWTSAAVAESRPDLRETYLPYVRHGISFLKETMWDKTNGGFYWELASDGSQLPGARTDKHAYGVSFAIYGLAKAYSVTHDPAVLELARDAFNWLERNAHDEKNGGYHEALSEEGTPLLTAPSGIRKDRIDTAFGCKSMNTHIHLMESFTELYRVWPDGRLKERVEELLGIILGRMIVEPGCQHLYYTADFRPLPDLCSYGHDVETAYLILETAAVLGKGNDSGINNVAKKLVDHALEYGFDRQNGGLFDRGPAYGKPVELTKKWWVQAEALNAFLLMHERYGLAAGTKDIYFQAFADTWKFIKQHQIDSGSRGWYEEVSPDGTQVLIGGKGHNWKAAYHTTRALLLVSDRLKLLHAGSKSGF